MLERNGKKDQLRDAICQAVGQPVGLRLEIDPAADVPRPAIDATPASGSGSDAALRPTREARAAAAEPAEAATAQRTPITAELRQSLRDSQPLIRRLMDEMGAEIIKVE
jgi:pyruvate/2-oxoglutarate dehydrogenase complex dihydrolipoamide acyltransferase (E2) component